MTFTATYRDRTGAKREEAIEAAGRAGCVAECRRRGITPLRVQEGNRCSKDTSRDLKGDNRQRPARSSAFYILVFSFVIAIAAAIAWWRFGDGREAAPALPEETSGHAGKPPAVDSAKPQQQSTAKPVTLSTNKPTYSLPPKAVDKVRETSQVDNSRPSWPPPPVQRDKNGRVIPPPGAITLDSQNSIFERSSDTYIAMLISPRVGESLPPMPQPGPAMEEEFLASLKEPIEISPDDSPEDKAIKLAVMAAREEIKRLLGTGVKFEDIVREHEMLLKDNNEIREKALSEYREILKSGDEKAAEKYFKTINAAMQKMGVPPMEKSKSHEEVRARMLEARARRQQEKVK